VKDRGGSRNACPSQAAARMVLVREERAWDGSEMM